MKSFITILLLSSFYAVTATASPRQVLATVSKEGADASWAKENCDLLHESINKSSEGNITTNCVWLQKNEMVNQTVKNESHSGKYVYLVDLREDLTGQKSLRIVNLNREDDTDLTQVAWKIEKGEDSKMAIHKLVKNMFEVDLFKKEIKTFFLANAIKESKQVTINEKGEFHDFTGNEVSPEEAYKIFAEESPKNKHYLRAGLEIVSTIGLATVNYYVHKEENARDWDFPTVHSAIESKFQTGHAYRFDDNSIGVNTGHAYAGTVYYMLARSNGLTSMESFLYTFTASTAWEFLVEFREVVSINDEILTPLGGFAIGEGFHQIARIFSQGKGKGSLVDKTIGAIFDSPTAMHKWADKHSSGKKDISETGFDDDFWSRFDIETALVKNSTGKPAFKYGFDAEIINIADFEETGVKKKLIADTAFTRMLLTIPQNYNAGEEYKFIVKNALAAYYKKNLGRDAKGNLDGYNFLIGPSNGVEFNSKDDDIKGRQDFMSVVNVLGSTMDLTLYSHGYKIRTTIDLFADFAMIRSYAIDKYTAENGKTGLNSVIARNDYYYAKGMTSAINVSVEKGKISFGAGYTDQRFSSVNDRARNQDDITNNIHLNDKKKELEIWVAYQITRDLKAKLSYSETVRGGGIENFGFFETTEKRTTGKLIYNFR